MIETSIWEAFSAAIASFAAGVSPPIPVIHQGTSAAPPDTGMWIETRFFPNETDNYGVANAGPSTHKGFCQATVCVRPGVGNIGALAVAESIVSAFKKGTAIGPAKTERQPWISSVLVESDRLRNPITIRYKAHATNG